MSDDAARPFGLLRYFTRASLGMVLGGALLAGVASAGLMRSILVHVEIDEAGNIVEYLLTEFAQDGHTRDQWGSTPLTAAARARALADLANFSIVEFTLLGPDGTVLETLVPGGASPDDLWRDGFVRATAGRVALRWENEIFAGGPSRGAVATYVPVVDDGRVVAVAKLRRDLSPVMARALGMVPGLVVLATAAGFAVFGALWLLVRRADRLIARQHGEIVRAREAIEERNRLLEEIRRKKDDFYAMCSHDLRSPLLSVHAATQLVLSDRDHPLAQEQRKFLEDNGRAVAGLLDLVDNLLELARADAPGNRLDVEPLDVSELLRAVVSTHRILPANHGVAIGERYPERGAPLVGDRHKLVRVFHNLLSNALKHGGGHPVEVIVEPTVTGVRVTVRDRGSGITAEMMGSLFDRYSRGRSGGTGLGLAIVKDLVEAHGGTVDAASSPGEGATLTVELPEYPQGFDARGRPGIRAQVPV